MRLGRFAVRKATDNQPAAVVRYRANSPRAANEVVEALKAAGYDAAFAEHP